MEKELSAEGAARISIDRIGCAGPSGLIRVSSANPALTPDCGTHLTLWVLVDLDVDLDLDLDVDPDYPVRHELSQA